LDANRFFGSQYEEDYVRFLNAKYGDRPISVIIVVGVSALDFIERNRERIWPSAPVVFVAIDEATITRRLLPQNVTGATMQLTLQDMVKVARMVVPDLDAVAIVGDPLERQTFYRHFKEEMPSVANQLKIIDLMNLPVPELKKQLSSLSERTAVLYTGIYYTSEGISYVPGELVSQIAEWANRPLVISMSSYLNKGAIGGYIVQAEPFGQQAARLALAFSTASPRRTFPSSKSLHRGSSNGQRCVAGALVTVHYRPTVKFGSVFQAYGSNIVCTSRRFSLHFWYRPA